MSSALNRSVRHPKVYAYTVEAFAASPWQGQRQGSGLIKIGDSDRDVSVRIREQLNAVKMPESTPYELFLVESAITQAGEAFRDHSVHKELQQAGVHRRDGEWFECTVDEVRAAITAVKRGTKLESVRTRLDFRPRPEQESAVRETAAYFRRATQTEFAPHFLWNAKMRFGKTFTSYQLAREMGWKRILVLTYKPAVETNWREDLYGHVDFEGWEFKGKSDPIPDLSMDRPLVWFASFQDVLGKDANGQPKAKNEGLYEVEWDVVVVDEYHFGAWRDAARAIYLDDKEAGTSGDSSEAKELDTPDLDPDFREDLEATIPFKVKHYLYLSGTPFRALTEGEFLEDQVFNWTYSDEQSAKKNWSEDKPNPYLGLPEMVLMTYEMPDALREVALNNKSEFSLTEFFKTEKSESGALKFKHERDVQKWLDLLRGQDLNSLWANVANQKRPPLPFENLDLLTALQHTVWYLPSVDSCNAMADLLRAQHNTFFRDYEIVVAAGSRAGIGDRALPPVEKAIGSSPQDSKSITLSCGKLMTGVTVKAWTGIFMLRELKSPESYFQAAFRVQSPWVTSYIDTELGGEKEVIQKERCFVLDFSPNRALRQIVDYATRLKSEAASEKDDEQAIAEFMEFLPVLSFDGYAMSQLKAGDVIDYLTRGVSSSMLARRWNSPELINLDIKSMENILANPGLLESLEQIEMFRNIGNDLTAMISSHKELRPKQLTKEPLNEREKKIKDESAKRRENLKQKLRRFITRIPAFMYLTDDREKTIKDIIEQVEPELFVKVTGLSLKDFKQLVDCRVFNDSKMDDAVWKFRSFENPSLSYFHEETPETLGGWRLTREEKFAALIQRGLLNEGDELVFVPAETSAFVTDDFGLLIDGIRYAGPVEAAKALGLDDEKESWKSWRLGEKTLKQVMLG
jgi:hypothetical protein